MQRPLILNFPPWLNLPATLFWSISAQRYQKRQRPLRSPTTRVAGSHVPVLIHSEAQP